MTATNAKPSTQITFIPAVDVTGFTMESWRAELATCCAAEATSVKRMLELVLQARVAEVEADTAREAFKDAYALAYAASFGAPYDVVIKSKTVLNRVSDAMAIFGAKHMPKSLPSTLQAAAKAVRELNPKSAGAGSKTPKKPVPATANGLAMLSAALEAVRKECGDNEKALEVVSSLTDLAAELFDALAAEGEESAVA
jgi:hypothetical protein